MFLCLRAAQTTFEACINHLPARTPSNNRNNLRKVSCYNDDDFPRQVVARDVGKHSFNGLAAVRLDHCHIPANYFRTAEDLGKALSTKHAPSAMTLMGIFNCEYAVRPPSSRVEATALDAIARAIISRLRKAARGIVYKNLFSTPPGPSTTNKPQSHAPLDRSRANPPLTPERREP